MMRQGHSPEEIPVREPHPVMNKSGINSVSGDLIQYNRSYILELKYNYYFI